MPKVIQTKSKLIKKFFIGFFGVASVGSLLILPFTSVSSAFADDLNYNVQIRPSLNVTVSSSTVSLLLNPGSTPYGTSDLTVSVGTNNFTGYKLYINADSTELTNNGYSTPSYIDTLEDTATGTTTLFPANKWGYRVSSLSSGSTADDSITDTTGTYFYPFSTNTLVGSYPSAINNSTSTLTFASKVDYNKPSGLYTLDFNFKAIPIVTTYDMQNLNPDVCTTDPTIVTDSRDGQAYTIARLADGNCWMLDNLRLDLTDEGVQSRLSSATTNASDEAINYLINGGGTGQWARSGVSKEWISENQGTYISPSIATSVEKSGDVWTKDDVAAAKWGEGSGKIGVYYNYCAASAGSYCYTNGSATGDTQYDVCPASWRLPTGGLDGEFQALCSEYKGSSCSDQDGTANALAMRNALSMLLSGSYAGSSFDAGDWWSSTINTPYHTYFLYTNSHNTIMAYASTNRNNGFSIRCMLPISQS